MAEIVEPIENFGLSKKDQSNALFSKVGLIGCGSVGQNIARMISMKGIEVIFIELSEEKIQTAYTGIEKEFDLMIEQWGITAGEKRALMSRIKGYVGYENLKGCDLVIESIRSKSREERISCRIEVFKEIEKVVESHAIIATNSTTIGVSELAAELEHDNRCVSLHFSTTAPHSSLVEVVRGLTTSDEAYNNVCKFLKLIGKDLIPVEESPGLISVRMLVMMINEACEMLMEAVGSEQNIDFTMCESFGMDLGPFEMADKIGLDKVMRLMDNLYAEFGDRKYKASPVIKKLVRAKKLGRITKKGFYNYNKQGEKINS